MSQDELDLLVGFSISKEIIVSDEIYSGTAFDPPRFISLGEDLVNKKLENSDIWKRVHIVYSLSKVLGLPGFRVGMIYSNNEKVISAATKMSSFGLISSQTQFLMSNILSDKEFTQMYIEENIKRLKKRKEMLVSGLLEVEIKCLRSNAGLFCWVDLRNLLDSNTWEAEVELWKKMVYEVGLNISPGSSCHCSEPGWFPVCFANLCRETLCLAIQRFQVFVETSMGGRNSYQKRLKLKDRVSRKLFTKGPPVMKLGASTWKGFIGYRESSHEN